MCRFKPSPNLKCLLAEGAHTAEIERFGQSGSTSFTTQFYKTTYRTLLSDLEALCRELPRGRAGRRLGSCTGTGGPIFYRYGNHYRGAPRLRDHPRLNMRKHHALAHSPNPGRPQHRFLLFIYARICDRGRASWPARALPAERSHPGEAVFHFLPRPVFVHGHHLAA